MTEEEGKSETSEGKELEEDEVESENEEEEEEEEEDVDEEEEDDDEEEDNDDDDKDKVGDASVGKEEPANGESAVEPTVERVEPVSSADDFRGPEVTAVVLSDEVLAALSELAAREAELAQVDSQATTDNNAPAVASKEQTVSGTTETSVVVRSVGTEVTAQEAGSDSNSTAEAAAAAAEADAEITAPRINPLTRFGDHAAAEAIPRGATDEAGGGGGGKKAAEVAVGTATGGDNEGTTAASSAAAAAAAVAATTPSSALATTTVTTTVEDGRVTTEKLLKTFDQADGVRCACVVGDGKQVWTGQRDGVVVRDQVKGQEVARVDVGPFTTGVWSMAAVPFVRRGGRVRSEVWVGTAQGEVLRFCAAEKEGRKGLPSLSRHTGGVYCLHLSKLASPCPSVFSCSNDWTVVQWVTSETESNGNKGLFLKQFSGHSNGVRSALAVGPKLWTCSDDATLRVWDLATSCCEVVIDHRRQVGLAVIEDKEVGEEGQKEGLHEGCKPVDEDAAGESGEGGAGKGGEEGGANTDETKEKEKDVDVNALVSTTTTDSTAAATVAAAGSTQKPNNARSGGGSRDATSGAALCLATDGAFVWSGADDGTVRLWSLTPPHLCLAATTSAAATGALEEALEKASKQKDKSKDKALDKVLDKVPAGGGRAGGKGTSSGFRITCLAPMGSVMWAVGQDQSIGVWDRRRRSSTEAVGPPRLVRRLKGHTAFVNSLCRVKCVELRTVWSCSSGDGTLRVWKQECCAGDGGSADDTLAAAAAAASSSGGGNDDMSLELAEARAAAATTAAHAKQLELKVGRFQETAGRAARLAEAREAELAAALKLAQEQAAAALRERSDLEASVQAAHSQWSSNSKEAAASQAEGAKREGALRKTLGAALHAVAVLRHDLLKAVGSNEVLASANQWLEDQLEAERLASAQAQVAHFKAEELHLATEQDLRARLSDALEKASQVAGLEQATVEGSARETELSRRLLELETKLLAESRARLALEKALEESNKERDEALHEALVARNQRGVWESKHRALLKARADEEAEAAARKAETELLEAEMRRKAREAAMDSGDSSAAATALRAELCNALKELEEVKQTVERERGDAKQTHGQFVAAKREVGDLKRLLAERDALLGASSNSKALAESAAASLAEALEAKDAALLRFKEAVESEASLALRYRELDVFRLDVIARELKLLDSGLNDLVHAKTQPPTVLSSEWCRGHVKDIINQCLKETHKLHIGAPLNDHMANGSVIAGCGKKAYLIVDAASHPEAITLDRD